MSEGIPKNIAEKQNELAAILLDLERRATECTDVFWAKKFAEAIASLAAINDAAAEYILNHQYIKDNYEIETLGPESGIIALQAKNSDLIVFVQRHFRVNSKS